MAKRVFAANKLIGGLAGCLDDIHHNSISDGDLAIVINSVDQAFYTYYYDSSSSDAESSPDIINPDSNTGNGRWIAASVAADIVGLTASVSELNQLDGIVVGGTSTGDIVTIDDTQTLTNKTLTSPTINTPTLTGGTVNPTTLQQNSVAIATLSGVETLTNKTLTSPKVNEDVEITATATEINTVCDGSTAKNSHIHMVADSYAGNGTSTRNITVGVTAKAVLLYSTNVGGSPYLMFWSTDMGTSCISINTTGLIGFAAGKMYGSGSGFVAYEAYGNSVGLTYYYVVWG